MSVYFPVKMWYYGNIGQLEDNIKTYNFVGFFFGKNKYFSYKFLPKVFMLTYIIILISSSIWTDIGRLKI